MFLNCIIHGLVRFVELLVFFFAGSGESGSSSNSTSNDETPCFNCLDETVSAVLPRVSILVLDVLVDLWNESWIYGGNDIAVSSPFRLRYRKSFNFGKRKILFKYGLMISKSISLRDILPSRRCFSRKEAIAINATPIM